MKFCIQCGEQNMPDDAFGTRCRPCWEAFQAAGGKVKRVDVVSEWAGMRVINVTYQNHSLYCRECGRPLGDSRRVKFALGRGSECHSCDACARTKKYLPTPPPSHDQIKR